MENNKFIIAGIGDKEQSINKILPEFDATVIKFIIGKNTIIDGFELKEKTLSAGTCILCGYRGIMEESKILDTTNYVYGEFILNFNSEIPDSFSIITATEPLVENVNPSEITSAGTYYLLLYENGVLSEDLDLNHPYPNQAYHSKETTEVVKSSAKIESEVEGVTHPVNDNSKRIATTQYVHNQIKEEIDANQATITLYKYADNTSSGGTAVVALNATLIIERKSKMVVGIDVYGNDGGFYYTRLNKGDVIGTVPSGYLPKTKQSAILFIDSSRYGGSGFITLEITIDTDGKIVFLNSASSPYVQPDLFNGNNYTILGYQCQ